MEASGCGIGEVWVLSDVKGGNGLEPLSFSSCLFPLVYRINREKRGKVERRMQFFYRLCLGEVKAFREGFRCFAWGFSSRGVAMLALKILLFCLQTVALAAAASYTSIVKNAQEKSHQSLFFFFGYFPIKNATNF